MTQNLRNLETVQDNQTNDSGPTAEDTMTMATPKQDAVAGSEEPLSVNEEESTDYTFPLLWVVAGTVLFIIGKSRKITDFHYL